MSQQDAPRRDQGRRQQGGAPCQGRDEGKSGGGGVGWTLLMAVCKVLDPRARTPPSATDCGRTARTPLYPPVQAVPPLFPVPLSYFLYQPVLHHWCNKGHGMCYNNCGIVYIKEPLLLIKKNSPCSPLYLSSPLPYV